MNMNKGRPGHLRIGQILIHLDIATPHQVSEARLNQMQLKRSQRLGEIMMRLGHIDEDGLNRALSLQRDMDDSEEFNYIPIE